MTPTRPPAPAKCPACGGSAEPCEEEIAMEWWYVCTSCWNAGPEAKTKEEALVQWNNRAAKRGGK